MDRTERSIIKLFLEKLGSSRLTEILNSLDLETGKTLEEKAETLLQKIAEAEEELHRLIADGFDGPYHQTIYLRRTNEGLVLENIPRDGINFEFFPVTGNSILCFIPYEMQFHIRESGGSISVWVAPMKVPARLESDDQKLILRVLTIGNAAWDRIFGQPIFRKVTNIQKDKVRDHILTHLVNTGFDVGETLDFSKRARDLISMQEVDTFSGTYIQFRQTNPVGSSTHRTIGSKSGRRPLRTDMPEQFNYLLNAEQLSMCDIYLKEAEVHALKPETRLVLYPDSGQVLIPSMIEEGDVNEFLDFLFSTD